MSAAAVASALSIATCFSSAALRQRQLAAAVAGALAHAVAFAAAVLTPALRVRPKATLPSDAEAAAARILSVYVVAAAAAAAAASAAQKGWTIKVALCFRTPHVI